MVKWYCKCDPNNGTASVQAGPNGAGTEIARYLAAAHLDAIPADRRTPRPPKVDPALRAVGHARSALATQIWCGGATDAERREVLAACERRGCGSSSPCGRT